MPTQAYVYQQAASELHENDESDVAILLGSAYAEDESDNVLDEALLREQVRESNARFRQALMLWSMAENRSSQHRRQMRTPFDERPKKPDSPLKQVYTASLPSPPTPAPVAEEPVEEDGLSARSRVASPLTYDKSPRKNRPVHSAPAAIERIPAVAEPLKSVPLATLPERPGLTPVRPPPKSWSRAANPITLIRRSPTTLKPLANLVNAPSPNLRCVRPPMRVNRRRSREIDHANSTGTVCVSPIRGGRARRASRERISAPEIRAAYG